MANLFCSLCEQKSISQPTPKMKIIALTQIHYTHKWPQHEMRNAWHCIGKRTEDVWSYCDFLTKLFPFSTAWLLSLWLKRFHKIRLCTSNNKITCWSKDFLWKFFSRSLQHSHTLQQSSPMAPGWRPNNSDGGDRQSFGVSKAGNWPRPLMENGKTIKQ